MQNIKIQNYSLPSHGNVDKSLIRQAQRMADVWQFCEHHRLNPAGSENTEKSVLFNDLKCT
jgi:hypothetical protein